MPVRLDSTLDRRPRSGARKGAQELLTRFREPGFGPPDFQGPRHFRPQHVQRLTVRWRLGHGRRRLRGEGEANRTEVPS
jgi:hypothetical protein